MPQNIMQLSSNLTAFNTIYLLVPRINEIQDQRYVRQTYPATNSGPQVLTHLFEFSFHYSES